MPVFCGLYPPFLLFFFDDCPRIDLEPYYIQNTVIKVIKHRKHRSLYWCKGYCLLPLPLPTPFHSLLFSSLLSDLGGDSRWAAWLDSLTQGSGWVWSPRDIDIRYEDRRRTQTGIPSAPSILWQQAEIFHDHSSHWIVSPFSICQLLQSSISFPYYSQA